MSPFVKGNKAVVIEVFNLQEMGYPLASTQADLTPVQKLFIALSYPVYQEAVKQATNKNQNQNSDTVTDTSFESRTQQRILEKRRKTHGVKDEQRLRSHIKPR